ncbi:hypothetical protein Q5P01_010793 [Channa striata]|uniref:Uncharacterized protein n=1 Tax=Channa striata TaxID=64152 RepID=A0AA88MTG8_CHASR|nr:hypothetical protein Q5P01_010793 [Channa striata]
MGCSSSSAQTVDQEKRPGAKPEESNGDTVAVRNGIVAEDAQTIEDQMQLPVQTALPEDLQPGTDDEAGAVLVALEAKEDLGSDEELLDAPEKPAPDAPDAPVAATAEVFTEPEEVVVAVEALHSVEEVSYVETEAPGVESDVAVQEEALVVVEVTPLEPVEAEQAKAAVDVEEGANLGAEGPADLAAPMEAEIASEIPAEPREQSETSEPASNETAAPNEVVGTCDATASSESFAPVDSEKPVIDAKLAEATIPEMPLLFPVPVDVQAESQPAAEEDLDSLVAPTDTGPLPEAESAAAADAVAQVVEAAESAPAVSETPAEVLPEAPPGDLTSDSTVDDTAPAEATPETLETVSAPDAAADPAHELLTEVVSAAEASQETESEKTKKED